MANILVAQVRSLAASGAQDFTVSGFGTPLAAMVILSPAGVDDTITSTAIISVGATDGTRQWSTAARSNNGISTPETNRVMRSDKLWTYVGSTGNFSASGVFTSWITNGIRITNSGVSGSFFITVILFGGAGLTGAYAGTVAQHATVDNLVDVTAPGFLPEIVFLAGVGDFNLPAADSQAELSLGVAVNDGSDTQKCIMWSDLDAVSPVRANGYISTQWAGGEIVGDELRYGVEIDAFDSLGFSLYTRYDNGDSDYFGYLALGGTFTAKCGISTTPIATGISDLTDIGFSPTAVGFFGSWNQTVNTKDTTAGTSISISCIAEADSIITEYSNNISADDNAAPTTLTKSLSDDSGFRMMNDGGIATIKANWSSWLSNGVRLNWSAVDTVARQYVWWAFKDTSVPVSLSGSTGDVSGALTKRTNKVLAGAAGALSGVLATGSRFAQTLAGTMGNLTGAVTTIKLTLKSLSGHIGYSNICTNGDFESEIWPTVLGTDSATQSTAQKKFGSASMRIAPVNVLYGGRTISVTGLTELTQYTLSGWIYVESHTAGSVILDLSGADENIAVSAANGAFTQYSVTFTTPAGMTSSVLRFYGFSVLAQANFVAYLDGVVLETGGVATPFDAISGVVAKSTSKTMAGTVGTISGTVARAGASVLTLLGAVALAPRKNPSTKITAPDQNPRKR